MREIIEIPVNTRKTVREVKEFVVAQVNAAEENEFKGKFDANLLRFREKTVDKVTKVYADDEILEKYSMHEGKQIAIQMLKEPEQVEEDQILIMVRQWDPQS